MEEREDVQLWLGKAALCELASQAFLLPTEEVAEALASGEYALAYAEVLSANGAPESLAGSVLAELGPYRGRDARDVLHELRREYTRLFVGAGKPLISPYAGVRFAQKRGRIPLLFVGEESMRIERFMKARGVGHRGGANVPLDHAGSMLEFAMYLCLANAGVLEPYAASAIEPDDYEEFAGVHLCSFMAGVAEDVLRESECGFFRAAAKAVRVLVEAPSR